MKTLKSKNWKNATILSKQSLNKVYGGVLILPGIEGPTRPGFDLDIGIPTDDNFGS